MWSLSKVSVLPRKLTAIRVTRACKSVACAMSAVLLFGCSAPVRWPPEQRVHARQVRAALKEAGLAEAAYSVARGRPSETEKRTAGELYENALDDALQVSDGVLDKIHLGFRVRWKGLFIPALRLRLNVLQENSFGSAADWTSAEMLQRFMKWGDDNSRFIRFPPELTNTD